MRCLYCGKGLALFKRLRGGGEFCSDAHRLKYQEEYNQLALSRLLQAQPPEDLPKPKPAAATPNGTALNGAANAQPGPVNGTPASVPAAAPANAARPQTRATPSPAVATLDRPEPPREPAPKPKLEVKPPAPASGFIPELPSPLRAATPPMSVPELEFAVVLRPESLARHNLETGVAPPQDAPVRGEALAMNVALHAADCGSVTRTSGVEERASARMAPVMTSAVVELEAVGDSAVSEWARRDQPLGFSLAPAAPGEPPVFWLGGVRAFDALTPEFGDLGRLTLAVEGPVEGLEEVKAPPGSMAPDVTDATTASAENPEPAPVAEMAAIPEPQPAPAAPMPIAPSRQEHSILPGIEPVHPEPVQIDPAFLQALANLDLAAERGPAPQPEAPVPTPAEARAPEPPAQPSFQIPEPVTRPLPLTLDGFPPGRARSAPAYITALRPAPEIQIPPPGALPLRPVMLFGAAPAPPSPAAPVPTENSAPAEAPAAGEEAAPKPTPEPESQAVKPPAARSDTKAPPAVPKTPGTKPAQAKVSETQAGPGKAVEVEAAPAKPKSKSEAKLELPKLETKAGSKADAPETKPEVKTGPERATGILPPPMVPPVTSVDLGLPSLQLDVAAKSRRPAPTVIIAVLVVAAAIGAVVYKFGLSSPKPAAPVPAVPVSDVVETGAPLAIADDGWIDDWAPQPPNPKVLRVLSILRGSLPLSDYRMEFQAQIETKALGWVFRALNQRNYYVTKLEVVKPGIEPQVEVVHFAMIDGEEETRVRVPLNLKVRVDTTYKIRFDVLGDRFTTYVQDQKVDEWTDNRIGRGGAGLYRERGEGALLKGTVRIALIAKKK